MPRRDGTVFPAQLATLEIPVHGREHRPNPAQSVSVREPPQLKVMAFATSTDRLILLSDTRRIGEPHDDVRNRGLIGLGRRSSLRKIRCGTTNIGILS